MSEIIEYKNDFNTEKFWRDFALNIVDFEWLDYYNTLNDKNKIEFIKFFIGAHELQSGDKVPEYRKDFFVYTKIDIDTIEIPTKISLSSWIDGNNIAIFSEDIITLNRVFGVSRFKNFRIINIRKDTLSDKKYKIKNCVIYELFKEIPKFYYVPDIYNHSSLSFNLLNEEELDALKSSKFIKRMMNAKIYLNEYYKDSVEYFIPHSIRCLYDTPDFEFFKVEKYSQRAITLTNDPVIRLFRATPRDEITKHFKVIQKVDGGVKDD